MNMNLNPCYFYPSQENLNPFEFAKVSIEGDEVLSPEYLRFQQRAFDYQQAFSLRSNFNLKFRYWTLLEPH